VAVVVAVVVENVKVKVDFEMRENPLEVQLGLQAQGPRPQFQFPATEDGRTEITGECCLQGLRKKDVQLEYVSHLVPESISNPLVAE